MGNKLM